MANVLIALRQELASLDKRRTALSNAIEALGGEVRLTKSVKSATKKQPTKQVRRRQVDRADAIAQAHKLLTGPTPVAVFVKALAGRAGAAERRRWHMCVDYAIKRKTLPYRDQLILPAEKGV